MTIEINCTEKEVDRATAKYKMFKANAMIETYMDNTTENLQ